MLQKAKGVERVQLDSHAKVQSLVVDGLPSAVVGGVLVFDDLLDVVKDQEVGCMMEAHVVGRQVEEEELIGLVEEGVVERRLVKSAMIQERAQLAWDAFGRVVQCPSYLFTQTLRRPQHQRPWKAFESCGFLQVVGEHRDVTRSIGRSSAPKGGTGRRAKHV